MKIQCPLCDFIADNPEQLREDWKTHHTYKFVQYMVRDAYLELYIKIHEKIAMYESLLNNDSVSELDKIKSNTRIVVLKSLLNGGELNG